jgi:hypothetical protein
VKARRARVVRLDACGVPVVGTSSAVVTSGIITVGTSPQYENTDPITVVNGAGELCVDEPGCAQLSRVNIEATFCNVNPILFSIMTGAPLVVDDATPTPNTVGFRIQKGGSCDQAFGLELWSDVTGQSCTTTTKQYWYSLWPFIKNPQWGDVEYGNENISFVITGEAYAGGGWGLGPYNVINVLPGPVPGKLLTAIGASDIYHGQVTTLAPPTAACDPIAIP